MDPYRSDHSATISSAEVSHDRGIVGDIISQFADPLAFYRELVQNSIDAGATSLEVRLALLPDGSVTSTIIDDGSGIPAEIQGSIFDPFFTTKSVGKGMGLGLDVVRRLLQRHDGEVAVESVPGRTEFQVRLPAEK